MEAVRKTSVLRVFFREVGENGLLIYKDSNGTLVLANVSKETAIKVLTCLD